MAGSSLSIYFSPLELGLVAAIGRMCAVLDRVKNTPWPLTQTGWAGLVHEAETNDWMIEEVAEGSLADCEGAAWNGTLKVRGFEMHARCDLFRISEEPCSTGLMVRFGTLLHRQLYPDLAQDHANEEPARALVEICLTLVDEMQAEAFVVGPNDEDVHCTVDVQCLRQGMLHPDWLMAQELPPFNGVHLAGLSSKVVNRADVVDAWGEGAQRTVTLTTSGIVLLNLLY